MPRPHVVFDIETVLDKEAAARAYNVDPADSEALKKAVGDFPKTPLHRIVAIAAMTLTYDVTRKAWAVREMASLHTDGGDDKELVRQFLSYLHATAPIVVTYNGASFDLPVVRSRAMIHRIRAPALATEMFKPYSRDHLDLCDVFWGRSRDRMTLDQSARIFGVGSKTAGVNGSKVEDLAAAREFNRIADYCLDDVLITAGLFLLHRSWEGALEVDRVGEVLERLRNARDRIVAERPDSFVRHNPMPLVPQL